jgi:hypothetical protein
MSLTALAQAFIVDSDINIGLGTPPTPNVRFTINNSISPNSWKSLILKNNNSDILSFGIYQIGGANNPYISSIDRTTEKFNDLYINNLGINQQNYIGNVVIAGKTTIGNNSNNVANDYILDVFSKTNNNIALIRNSNLELRFTANSNINISTNNNNLNINSRTYISDFISINSNNFVPNSNERLIVNGISVFNSNVIINGRISGSFILDSDTSFSERNKLPASFLKVRANSGLSCNVNNEIFVNIKTTDSGLILNNNEISLNPIIPNIQTYGKIVIGNITPDVANYSFYTNSNSKFNSNVIIGSNPTSTSINLNEYILNINGNMGITGNIFNASDSNLKKNIETYPNALDKILKCRGVLYEFKDDYTKNIGVIAQEIEKIIPEIVQTTSNGFKNVNYLSFIGIIIEAIKDLNNKIELINNAI